MHEHEFNQFIVGPTLFQCWFSELAGIVYVDVKWMILCTQNNYNTLKRQSLIYKQK